MHCLRIHLFLWPRTSAFIKLCKWSNLCHFFRVSRTSVSPSVVHHKLQLGLWYYNITWSVNKRLLCLAYSSVCRWVQTLTTAEGRKGKCRDLTCSLNADWISLICHMNQMKKMEGEKQNKKTNEQLSPEMVIKSVNSARIAKGYYGGKDLWKR